METRVDLFPHWAEQGWKRATWFVVEHNISLSPPPPVITTLAGLLGCWMERGSSNGLFSLSLRCLILSSSCRFVPNVYWVSLVDRSNSQLGKLSAIRHCPRWRDRFLLPQCFFPIYLSCPVLSCTSFVNNARYSNTDCRVPPHIHVSTRLISRTRQAPTPAPGPSTFKHVWIHNLSTEAYL